MSVSSTQSGSHDEATGRGQTMASAGPLGFLPRLSLRQVELERRLRHLSTGGPLSLASRDLDALRGPDVISGPVDVMWRASGMRRPGLVAQFSWPRLATRFALGIETPLAHALVDRLLGYERLDAEGRLQLSPVEWGIGAVLVARGLSSLCDTAGPLGPWDLVLDRTGPDPFDVQDLGSIVTLRWGVRVGKAAGSLRLWIPESLVTLWLATDSTAAPVAGLATARSGDDLGSSWRAEAGLVDMPRGLGRLRVGGVLPLNQSRLQGTPQSPSGTVELACTLSGRGGRLSFPAEPVPHSGGGHLRLGGPVRREPTPREALALNPPTDPSAAPAVAPTDIPVTLTVELGRVNLTLGRLADLKPGDVVELGRHSREPVELTSNGRLVARGELVLIDTELGVRVTSVFL